MANHERAGMVAVETIEIPAELYAVLQVRANKQKTGVRHLVIDALETYVKEHPAESTEEARPVDVSRLLPRLLTDQ